MTTRMLIDARHREETRVAVVKGNRIEEFDFESAERRQLKGNIYLAKVTRVEPSLQAAFVDYGGNRHGFLAFSEIHPDYYQIPKEDREALLREEAEHAAEEERLRARDEDEEDEDDRAASGRTDAVEEIDDADDEGLDEEEGEEGAPPPPAPAEVGDGEHHDENTVETLRRSRMNIRRRYKIQDVIRRRQVLLVQVVKEERGNKGAALTTYLSLAGRYCVLMPNTSHGGGISRKISNGADRKRLKSIMAELKLPSTMGCIVRTAGLQRTKTEIKRDFDYLARLWDEIRDKTLHSSAPALIYEDSNLIKRAIRDIYNREIDEVIVEGEESFRAARTFMKLLMPSHARRIQPYADVVPLFQRFGVEDQLSAMYQPLVQLKSGGYLVINPTEALVSIDINSGRSTREHNIEQTALSTNMEAAREIARQLRLRDMAGLVVIDFIDMENNSNVRKVEKAMKEALKDDRARIQVGRISSFGLMEMSRQRLRTGVLEASTRTCPHCEGTGLVRTASSAALGALRMIEEEAARGRGSRLLLRASQEAAFYILNRKRAELAEIEDRYGVLIEVISDGAIEGARMTIEAGGPPPLAPPKPVAIAPFVDDDEDLPEEEEEEEELFEEPEEATAEVPRREREAAEGEGRRRRRRRRRGGRREGGEGSDAELGAEAEAGQDLADAEDASEAEAETLSAEAGEVGGEEGAGGRRRRRRNRRGGRGRNREDQAAGSPDDVSGDEAGTEAEPVSGAAEPISDVTGEPDERVPAGQVAAVDETAPVAEAPADAQSEAEDAPEATAQAAPRSRRRPRARKADAAAAPEAASADPVTAPADEVAPAAEPAPPAEAEAPAKPKRTRRKAATPDAEPAAAEPVAAEAAPEPSAEEAPKPRRRSRRKADAEPAPADAAAPEPVLAQVETPLAPAPTEETVTDAEAEETTPDATANGASAAAAAEDGTAGDQLGTDAQGPTQAPRRGWWQRTFGS